MGQRKENHLGASAPRILGSLKQLQQRDGNKFITNQLRNFRNVKSIGAVNAVIHSWTSCDLRMSNSGSTGFHGD
jgi:hypothetical protein